MSQGTGDGSGHVLLLVAEAKRLRALANAETNLVHQRALHLEADKIDREIAISNVKTSAALAEVSNGEGRDAG